MLAWLRSIFKPRGRTERDESAKRVAFPLNAPGDFYVEDQMCIACGAPEQEAPGLISHDETYHCYFKRQPVTSDEITRAIGAIRVCCCGSVRYRGHDPKIIAQIKVGRGWGCDHA